MGANGRKLNIDLNSEFGVPKTISDCLAEVSAIGDVSLKLSKLGYFLHALEDESRKIDAFKRELPLSMHIINHAIEKVKVEVVELKRKEEGPVMEEFLPLKGNCDEGGGAKRSSDESDKKSWMNSATLWNNPVEYDTHQFVHRKSNEGGAFQPYKRIAAVKVEEAAEKATLVTLPINGLSESTPLVACERDRGSIDLRLKGGRGGNGQPQSKKQRRCWSPELHQRFVDALDKLGGAQAATPKQIIDIMRVDGLTNDEVKSHLQKYRLHCRRLPSSSSSADHALKVGTQSGSPEGPLHLSGCAKEISMTLTNIPEQEEDEISESSWKGRLVKQGHV